MFYHIHISSVYGHLVYMKAFARPVNPVGSNYEIAPKICFAQSNFLSGFEQSLYAPITLSTT